MDAQTPKTIPPNPQAAENYGEPQSANVDAGSSEASGKLSLLLDEYTREILPVIEAGKKGRFKLKLTEAMVSLTDNCNLRCGWCHPAHYGFVDRNRGLEDSKSILDRAGGVEVIDFMSPGEVFANPEFMDILRYAKEAHPDKKLAVTSNGTYSFKKKYREVVRYVDQIYLSMDGATAETFEKLREPARFNKVLENIKELIAAKNEHKSSMKLMWVVTLSNLNFHELPALVELAASLKGVDGIHASPLSLRARPLLDKYGENLIEHMPGEHRLSFIREAKGLAVKTGISLSLAPALYPEGYRGNEEITYGKSALAGTNWKNFTPEVNDADHRPLVPFCRFVWEKGPLIHVNGEVSPCCVIPWDEENRRRVKERYDFGDPKTDGLEEIFNSPGFWKFREDLLCGKTLDICGNCVEVRTDFNKKYLGPKRTLWKRGLISVTTLAQREAVKSAIKKVIPKSLRARLRYWRGY